MTSHRPVPPPDWPTRVRIGSPRRWKGTLASGEWRGFRRSWVTSSQPGRSSISSLARPTRKAPGTGCPSSGASRWSRTKADFARTALETLKRATEDGKKVVAETSKGDIYFNIVFAQCQIGDFDGVLRIVESLQGKLANDRQTYLQYLARDCDKAGPVEARRILAKALELSKAIPDVYPRGLTQKMIAQAMARNGDIPGALAASKLIGQVDEAPARTGIFSFFNRRQAEGGPHG